MCPSAQAGERCYTLKLLLDRWQFGVTITYQFLFVTLTRSRSAFVMDAR
jgi:hypothetical protein